jgi:tetratricopeptide (TPR) repeat protein
MSWTKEEKDKILKLLFSVDSSNQQLALEMLKHADSLEEFASAIIFLTFAEIDLEMIMEGIYALMKKLPTNVKSEWAGILSVFKFDYKGKSQLLEQLEKFEEKAELFESYIAIGPHYAHIYNRLGNELIYAKSKTKGLEYLKKGATLNHNSYSLNFDYAYNLNESKKNADEMIKHYTRCLVIKDDHAVYHNLGRVYAHQKGNSKKAAEIFGKCISVYPESSDTMIELALALEDLGQLDEARSMLYEAIEIDEYSHLAYNNLAYLLWMHFDEFEFAKQNINIALQMKPNDGLYWHTLAEVEWYGFKNKENALAALYKGKEVQKSYKGGDELIKELEAK